MLMHPFIRCHQLALTSLLLVCGLAGLLCSPVPAQATGTTWVVDQPGDDASNGDIVSQHGSLRFALAHALSGDLVRFGSISVDTIFVGSTLTVPAGVDVGGRRDQPCQPYRTPFINIEDASLSTLDPIISLGAGATLRGLALGGGRITVRITGPDAEICGAALGVIYESDGNPTSLQPAALALSVDGARATIRQCYINGAAAVSPRGSDTRIGDAIGGSGDGNDGVRDAAVTVVANSQGAAQRVTIRDPFPRGLVGLVGKGVSGGDDEATHANNWVQTPTITSATTGDGSSVLVQGTANPLSLVDIYLDTEITISAGASVYADAAGAFSYNGPLPNGTVRVYAASTLADAAHPYRVGSSSQWTGPAPVVHASSPPLLEATARVVDLNGPESGPARAGDTLRFAVTITNVGQVDVTNLNSTAFQLPSAVTISPGSGKILGQGGGFVATDSGFANGMLAPGKTAVYQLDGIVRSATSNGAAVYSLEVNGAGVVSIPVVGRMRIAAGSPATSPRVWLPFVAR